MPREPEPRAPRELTGRMVLACLLAFFGVVFTVNGIMVRAATSSFGGLETANAYKAGLAFKQEIDAAHMQEARHWKVDAALSRLEAGIAKLEVTLRDGRGTAPAGMDTRVRLVHPADARRDHDVPMRERTPGVFAGEVEAAAGQWDLVIEVARNGERVFRSKSRALLR